MQCLIHRRAQFSASHRYWLPELTPEENLAQFGAGSRFPGHGHNYVLYVSLWGEIDAYGMVENLSTVKRVIQREVTSQLDYSYLNQVWPEFELTLPTTECIAQSIWRRLAPHLPLARIRLFEHPELWVDYSGVSMQATLTVKTHFSAAHRLALPELSLEQNSEIYGKCARVNGHGHNYHLEVSVTGAMDERTGMIVDLDALQGLVKDLVVEPFDHTFLNKDIPYFAAVVPTAENIALHIAQLLQAPVRGLGVELEKVTLIESPNNSVEILCRQTPSLPVLAVEPALAQV
ncbi:MAG: 6-pyruvoyl trahydropterin synthase family protein [Cyanobacteriota bacterium]|jgi:6-pyruvoyltetrahydropterin/6-carboxytetrahydropterin synthase